MTSDTLLKDIDFAASFRTTADPIVAAIGTGRPTLFDAARMQGIRDQFALVDEAAVLESFFTWNPQVLRAVEQTAQEAEPFFPDLMKMEIEVISGEPDSLLITFVESAGTTRDIVDHLDAFIRGWVVGLSDLITNQLAFTARGE